MHLRHSAILLGMFFVTTSLGISPSRVAAEYNEYVSYRDALAHATLPGEVLSRTPMEFPSELFQQVPEATKLPLNPKIMRCFQARKGEEVTGYACVDNVIGRKRFITYIIRVEHPEARIGFIELMTYREKIGANVRFPRFKDQLVDKTLADPLQVNKDIRRIYGATMSCEGLTRGTRRMLMLYDGYFRDLPAIVDVNTDVMAEAALEVCNDCPGEGRWGQAKVRGNW